MALFKAARTLAASSSNIPMIGSLRTSLCRRTISLNRCLLTADTSNESPQQNPVSAKSSLQTEDGVVHIALPLPTSGQTRFTLLPGLSIGHLARDIKEEDDDVTVVKALDNEGVALAQSTLLQQALTKPFVLQVNDTQHSFEPLKAWPKPHTPDADTLMARLQASVQVLEAEQHRRQQLRDMINQAEAELKPLEEARIVCENRANAAARRQAWLGFAGLGFGFGFLYRLTWFDYSWDLMEPVTYFVGLSVNICIFAYYLFTQRDHSMETRRERIELTKFHSIAAGQGLDISKYNTLKEQIAAYRAQLHQL
eukprot:TRINITY_DN12295_c0_g5_i4.p1 TRINITY_DN12295_c0_g5~~TRINITY_DN12295_c0_g5_i4.p1  ORF type:complete len:310 (+),score=64.44 TRINITY_DN12295_c0_g5_i4:167-1096(+)